MRMIIIFVISFVFFVPVLSFTLKDNIIRDDEVLNNKHLKSLLKVPTTSKIPDYVGQVFEFVPSHSNRKRNRKRKHGKRRQNAFTRSKKEMEEEKALQRAITFTNPMVPLKFRDTVKKKPKKKNLKPERLLRKMGADFNPSWMSIETPHTITGKNMIEVSQSQISRLFLQVNGLDLETDLKQLIANNSSESIQNELQKKADINREVYRVNDTTLEISKMASIFTQWLVQKSVCPVTFTWTDLGIYFWPRWIKSGSCQSNSKSSVPDSLTTSASTKSNGVNCSWPKGMKCGQDDVKTLQILRWHCRKRRKSNQHNTGTLRSGRKRHMHRCKWYKVPYPITTSCKCSCN